MPSVSEMLDYYGRSDVLSFIYMYMLSHPVAMIFSEVMNNDIYTTSIVKPKSSQELLETIETEVRSRKYQPHAKPVNYISFHQVLWPTISPDKPFSNDIVFEADAEDGYRVSLRSLKNVSGRLDDFGIPYRVKFSGVGSSKTIIPREVFPEDIHSRFPAEHGDSLRRKLCGFLKGDSPNLEQPPAIRIPYSLNELTGLVSLPIEPGDMESFKPWWANPNIVTVDEGWYDIPGDAQERFAGFLDFVTKMDEGVPERKTAKQHVSKGTKPKMKIQVSSAEDIKKMLESPEEPVRAEAAWELMLSERPEPEAIIKSLGDSSTDVRWFATEALARSDIPDRVERLIGMLEDEDDFVRGSAADGIGSIGIEAALYILGKLSGGGHICYLPQGMKLALRAFDGDVKSKLWKMAESDPAIAKGVLVAWRAFSQKYDLNAGNKLLELAEGHLSSVDDQMKTELLSELLCRFFYHEDVRGRAAKLMRKIDPKISSNYTDEIEMEKEYREFMHSGFRDFLSRIVNWF